MMRFRAIAFGLALVRLIFAVPSHLLAYTGEKLAKGAKVNIEDARAMRSKLNRERFPTKNWSARGAAAVFATPSISRVAA